MKKKMIKKTVEELSIYDFDNKLDNVIELLKDLQTRYNDYGWTDLEIDVYHCINDDVEVNLIGFREETKEDIEREELEHRRLLVAELAYKRRQFESLKKELGEE